HERMESNSSNAVPILWDVGYRASAGKIVGCRQKVPQPADDENLSSHVQRRENVAHLFLQLRPCFKVSGMHSTRVAKSNQSLPIVGLHRAGTANAQERAGG